MLASLPVKGYLVLVMPFEFHLCKCARAHDRTPFPFQFHFSCFDVRFVIHIRIDFKNSFNNFSSAFHFSNENWMVSKSNGSKRQWNTCEESRNEPQAKTRNREMYREIELQMENGRGNHVDVMICHGYTCDFGARSNTLIHFYICSSNWMRVREWIQQNHFFASLFLFAAKKMRQTVIKTYNVCTSTFNFETMSFGSSGAQAAFEFSNRLSLLHSSDSKWQHCWMKLDLSWFGLGFWSNDGIQSSKTNKSPVCCTRNGIIPKRCHNVRNIENFYVPFN